MAAVHTNWHHSNENVRLMSQRHYDSHYKHLIVRRLRASSGVVEDNDILAICRAGRLQIPASQELCEELFVHFEGPESAVQILSSKY